MPSPQRPKAATGAVHFDEILSYVMRRLRMTEAKAAFHVSQVLKAGVAFNRIEKLPEPGFYRLRWAKPPGLACKIKEMTDEEDSASSVSSSE